MKDVTLSARQRRQVVWLITAALHGWLLYLLLHSRPFILQREHPEQWTTLLLLPAPELKTPESPQPLRPSRSQSTAPRANAASSSSAHANVSSKPSNAITIQPQEQSAETSKPAIDWDAAAAISSKDLAAQLNATPQQRALDGSDKKESAKPKKQSEFEWSKTKRFGLTPAGLPYVRLNRRCVWSILVGCAIGKLSPPNRDLFKGMNDPDEVKDSVPDSKEQP